MRQFAARVHDTNQKGDVEAYPEEEWLASLASAYGEARRSSNTYIDALAAVDVAVERVATSRDPADAYDVTRHLAVLSAEEVGIAKSAFKAALGARLTMRDMDRAISEARSDRMLAASGEQRRAVVVTNRPLPAVTDDALSALVVENDPPKLFVRENRLVRYASAGGHGRAGAPFPACPGD